MSKQDGGSAFPQISRRHEDGQSFSVHEGGATLRDYFAAAALRGLLANSEGVHAGTDPSGVWRRDECVKDYVSRSYIIADAMLAERTKAGE